MDFDLKEVFAILDENNEGQIQLRRFVDVANNYYSDAEQLARITKALDPENIGLINFEQFCHGISQISSLQGVSLKDVASDLTRLSRENSLVEDSDQRSVNQDGSTTTFNEYDVESDEISPQKISSTRNNTQNNPNSNQSISSTLDSSILGDEEEEEEEFSGIAEPESTEFLHPRALTPQRIAHVKRNTYSQATTSLEEVDSQILHETVEGLQKTVDLLTNQKHNTTDRLAKIQSENTDLKSRLLTLEDRFHDLEGQQARSVQSEKEKYSVYINQKDRSFLQDQEVLQTRLNAIENELQQTQTTNGQMRKDVRQLKEKLEDVDIQLNDSQIRCNYLAEDNEKLLEQLRLQREELDREKSTNAQLTGHLTPDSSRQIFGRTENLIKASEIHIQDLDAQIRALKLENEKLKQENDDIRERTIAAGLDEGRRLMANRQSLSYAAELEVLSKDELMSKLREQFVTNDRLREYIERMLSVIIENNPQLLEVAANYEMSSSSYRKPSVTVPVKEIEPQPVPLEPPKATKPTNDNS